MHSIQDFDFYILKNIHTCFHNAVFDIICPIARQKLTWLPLYFILIYYFRKKYSNNFLKIVCIAIFLVSCSDVLCAQILKPLFNRIRPCHVNLYSDWLRNLIPCSSTYSFPSCHATNHTALAFFVGQFVKRIYKILLAFWVLIIGFSQIYVGVHYPSDIIGGIIIGSFLFLIAGYLYQKWTKIEV